MTEPLAVTERRIRRGANVIGVLWLTLVVLTCAHLKWAGFLVLIAGTVLAVLWAVLQELRSDVLREIRRESDAGRP